MQRLDRVNILVVDDQPAKLLSYEAVLAELNENLIKANSAREALEHLLKSDVAVILVDVCMPELDGFQLAQMIREHPRFRKIAIVFISAVQLDDLDRLRGYQLGAVDYVPVPIIPELLRAKVKVFVELYRKTWQLEHVNQELERRVAERTADLEAANARLQLAIDVAQLGTWDWDLRSGEINWSDRHFRIFGYQPGERQPSVQAWCDRLHPEDSQSVKESFLAALENGTDFHQVYRCQRPDGSIAWCEARAQQEVDAAELPRRMMGVVMDITEHKLADERQRLMLQELHHRVKNSLATVQAIAGLTARTVPDLAAFQRAFSSRLQSLGRTHTMLLASDWQRINMRELLHAELGSFGDGSVERFDFSGPSLDLPSDIALSLGLAFHELATNAAKYGALSVSEGRVEVNWTISRTNDSACLHLAWSKNGGPPVMPPERHGFGSTLLQKAFTSKDGAAAELSFPSEGVRFRATIPYHVPPSSMESVVGSAGGSAQPTVVATAVDC